MDSSLVKSVIKIKSNAQLRMIGACIKGLVVGCLGMHFGQNS